MNNQNAIGVNNQLPWHIPEDLKHFKQVTYGKPVIMGRKTFDSIGRILPGRKNIVISRNSNLHIADVSIYSSLQEAITDNQDYPEICIIGGGEIFKQALSIADKLQVTIVDYPLLQADTFFPEIDVNIWQLSVSENIISSNNISCQFNTYLRVSKS